MNYGDINALAAVLETNKIEVVISTIDIVHGAESENALIRVVARLSVTKRYISGVLGIRHVGQ